MNKLATSVPGFTTFEQLQADIEVAYNLEYTTERRNFSKIIT